MGNTEDNPIRVYRCEDGNVDQQWDGFQSNGQGKPFELHPRRDTNRCVGQLHHPKRQERVIPRNVGWNVMIRLVFGLLSKLTNSESKSR